MNFKFQPMRRDEEGMGVLKLFFSISYKLRQIIERFINNFMESCGCEKIFIFLKFWKFWFFRFFFNGNSTRSFYAFWSFEFSGKCETMKIFFTKWQLILIIILRIFWWDFQLFSLDLKQKHCEINRSWLISRFLLD